MDPLQIPDKLPETPFLLLSFVVVMWVVGQFAAFRYIFNTLLPGMWAKVSPLAAESWALLVDKLTTGLQVAIRGAMREAIEEHGDKIAEKVADKLEQRRSRGGGMAAALACLAMFGASCTSTEEASAVAELGVLQRRAAVAGEAERVEQLDAYDGEARRLSRLAMRQEFELMAARAAMGAAASRPSFSFDDLGAALAGFDKRAAEADAEFAAKRKEFGGRTHFEQVRLMSEAIERWARTKKVDAQAVEKIRGTP